MPTGRRRSLTPIERNLLRYIIQFESKNPGKECVIPPRVNSQTKDYVRAILYLEEHDYITIEKPTNHHRTWKVATANVPDAYAFSTVARSS
jgi:hypothetical protein